MYGNGLSPQLWEDFRDRFRIPQISEFFASTEGNFSSANNYGVVGAVGFLQKHFKQKTPQGLIRVDEDTREPIRDPVTGLCQECGSGEPGELVAEIANFDRGGPKNFKVSRLFC